jgi:FixJ family two-component response regulator
LEKFEKTTERIHLLLTDVIMPGGNGRELAEKLCAKNPNLKVLFMSGYVDQIISHYGMLEGGIKLVQKPFNAEDLLRQVREVLDTPIKR